MKTIKDQFDELNKAVIDAILNDDFTIKEVKRPDPRTVTIEVDSLVLSFWITEERFFESISEFGVKSAIFLDMNDDERRDVYRAIERRLRTIRKSVIGREIESLKSEINRLEDEQSKL